MTAREGRDAWTSRRAGAAPQGNTSRKGVAVHWPGFRFDLGVHSSCLALVKRLEAEAVRGGVYSALPYNQLACPHGRLIEGRGVGARSGANGSSQANASYGSVCALLSVGDKPTDAMLLALRAALTDQAKGGRLVTHRDVRPHPTACPGPALTAWIRAGAPAPSTPKAQRVHVVREGETLWGLAVAYYRDGGKWRRIAQANDIGGTDVAPGDRLVIP